MHYFKCHWKLDELDELETDRLIEIYKETVAELHRLKQLEWIISEPERCPDCERLSNLKTITETESYVYLNQKRPH